ncbi:MAG: Rpn family recombination-promoting nuclease/putative transposase [Candidatus Poribacteria bacterium]|nr:Rpn family recombination-promoting nuclease/putative transposase [Candidatus Poribacteria bacterium]
MAKERQKKLTFFDFSIQQFPDRSIRWLLENKENVRGLIEIVAEELVDRLDFSQLTQINTSFIPDNLREQESDLVYRVPFRSESQTDEVVIYILIEHQSTVDMSMGFRVLFYMLQIWDAQRREWQAEQTPKSQWRFHPILPVVLYTGEAAWDTPLTLSALMDVPAELSRFVPEFETLFLSVKGSDAAALTKTGHPLGWLLRVLQNEHADKASILEALEAALAHISALDAETSEAWGQAFLYLYLLISHRRPVIEHEELKTLIHQHIQDTVYQEEIETMEQTMAEYLFEQGEKHGEKRGETRTKREDILKLLHLRFGEVPEVVRRQVTAIRSHARLDALFEAAATAQTLDDIEWNAPRRGV